MIGDSPRRRGFLPVGKQWVVLSGCVVVLAVVVVVRWGRALTRFGTTTVISPISAGAPDSALAGAEWEELFAGDAAAGERIFFDPHGAGCSACHRAKGRGSTRGPNLAPAAKIPLRQLVQDIVDPNATLTSGFESVLVVTTDGRIITGWRVPLDHAQKVLVRLEDDRTLEIPRSEVAEGGLKYYSAMPTNYAQQLSLQDFRDLIAFLRSPSKEPVSR